MLIGTYQRSFLQCHLKVGKEPQVMHSKLSRQQRILVRSSRSISPCLGAHKFIAAHYKFQKGSNSFLEAYAKIVRDFLVLYPDAWMFFGYKTIPHVSVASTGNPGQKVIINTAQCRRINDVELMFKGRELFISAGYKNPQTNKMTFIKSQPL